MGVGNMPQVTIILTITVGHIQSYVHREMRAEGRRIQTFHKPDHCLCLEHCYSGKQTSCLSYIVTIWTLLSIACTWRTYMAFRVTFRTRSWSSIMPRSLPAAWAIRFPATRLPTMTDAGPTPTAREVPKRWRLLMLGYCTNHGNQVISLCHTGTRDNCSKHELF